MVTDRQSGAPRPPVGERRAGAALARLGPAAGLAVVGIAVLAAVLVPFGLWRPWLALPAAAAVLAASWRSTRDLPAPPAPTWTAVSSLGLSLAFTVWAALTHAEHVIIRRDPGAYALYTQWIATHGGLPIPADLAAFGGDAARAVEGFTLDSPAFYQVDPGGGTLQIVPQFLVGSPALFSLGWWLGEPFGLRWQGMWLLPAVLTGLALVALAGLAARLLGPRWAPMAVAALGLSFPVLHAARSTYSEPAALLLVLAAAALAVDALRDDDRRTAVLAGAVLGLANLVRVDAVREVALVVACCAVLALARRRSALPLAAAALAGTALSIAVWFAMARPYLQTVQASLRPLLAATVLVVLGAGVAVPLARRTEQRWRPLLDRLAHRERDAGRGAVAAVVLLGVGLAARPLFQTVRQDPDDPGARFVASLQAGQNLPVDGGRTYAEHTVQWVAWWTGWPALVVAWAVLAVLAGRALSAGLRRERVAAWALPAAVGLGSTVLVLYRPGITPDHPWADRRLVPVVLPVVALAATAAFAWAVDAARRRASARGLRGVAVVGVLGLLGPAALATAPFTGQRTEAGEVGAVGAVCRGLRPADVVLAVDATPDGTAQRSANEWVQVVRGLCGLPAGALLTPRDRLPKAVSTLAALAAAHGHRLVLLTAQEDGAAAQRVLTAAAPGATVGRAVRWETVEDRKLLTRRPSTGALLVIDVWLAVPAAPAGAVTSG